METHGLLDGSQHAALDVGDGLGVDGSQLVDQAVVQRQQGQVEEETLSHCVLGPGRSHLCLNKNNNGAVTGNDEFLFRFQLDIGGAAPGPSQIMASTSSHATLTNNLLHDQIHNIKSLSRKKQNKHQL